MGRVLTNNVQLSVFEETALGTAGTNGVTLEPNTLGTFGATISTIVRNPIQASRQRKKGTITDLDSSAEFEHDLGYDVVKRMMRGFMFARGANEGLQDIKATALAVNGSDQITLTIPALAAGTNTKLAGTSLVWIDSSAIAGNNGLVSIRTAPADQATSLVLGSDLGAGSTAETTTDARVSLCGTRIASSAATTCVWDADNNTLTIASSGTAIGTQATTAGMQVGQLVHIGSIPRHGGAIQNAFHKTGATGVADEIYGYGRVKSTSANSFVIDKVDTTLKQTGTSAENTDPTDDISATAIDVIFGDFVRPQTAGSANYLEQSYTFELLHPNLGDGSEGSTASSYVYSVGNFCNTLGLSLPLNDKATISFAFIGTDTRVPTTTRGSVPGSLTRTEAMNTTNDIARLRLQELDEDGISTDFKSLTFNINNNVSPEKVIANLGARFMNTGEFAISIETQLLFTDPGVLTAIRDNETVTMDFILKNNEGILGFDIPGMTLGDGSREYPENESVLVNITAETFEDPIFNSAFSFSTIPIPLP